MKSITNRVNQANMLAMRNRWMVLLLAAVLALPAMAGWNTAGINKDVTTMQPTFHSTSTMQGSGSPHSYEPASLNEEGRAAYVDPFADPNEETIAYFRRGPHKSIEYNVEVGDDNDPGSPIGDAMIPLLIMALAYAFVLYKKRSKGLEPLHFKFFI